MGVVCCFLACGCAATPETSTRPAAGNGNGAGPATYVVRPQDTLYGIAWRHNLDYRELAKWNNVGGDYKLTVGQVLVLQPGGARQGSPRPAEAPTAKPSGGVVNSGSNGAASANGGAGGAATAGGPRVGKPRPLGDAPAAAGGGAGAAGSGAAASGGAVGNGRGEASEPAVGGGNWVWPTNRVSAPRPVPGGGILVLGQLGQDVRAAASGRVVYTGSGLRGYGNLIIIKHGDSLLSSYAHNREMLVHEGQDVAAGQVIAHMGTGPHQISALYFEIRVNGKPVDPLRYLSASR